LGAVHVRLIAFLTLLLALVAIPARAYTPPPMTAHVTDAAGKLTEDQRLAIDRKLEDYRLRTSNEIAVFIPKSLEGESVEDVANKTARTWKLGTKEKGNGVLLLIAPVERKARIETNTGVQGALTDIQTNDILREKVRPHLAPGHEDYDAAIEAATEAIMADLDAGGVGGGSAGSSAGAPAPRPAGLGDVLFALIFFGLMLGVPILFVILFIRGLVSAFSSNGRSASRGWASGSSWSNDSSWSSGGSSWSSSDSGGGGGDSGFTGGGSDTFDGGGSSDSF